MNQQTIPPEMIWQWFSFAELSASKLYDILKLRQEVFVVEQKCVYLDCDGQDKNALHLWGSLASDNKGSLAAYLRIILPGIKSAHPAIGRLLTDKKLRNKSIGRQLLSQAISKIDIIYPACPINISAQLHLEYFYRGFGFMPVSEPYDEDGIDHIDMIKYP